VLASFDTGRTAAVCVKDAALATSAAPTYFPAHRVKREDGYIELMDGGIAANAPDAVAIQYAVKHLTFREEQIALLSIGTCGSVEGAASARNRYAGIFGALTQLGGTGIVNLMMAIQEDRGVRDAAIRLGSDRYLRIDRIPSSRDAAILHLDNASNKAKSVLYTLADAVHKDHLSKMEGPVWKLLRARAQAIRT
jgi:hypothetical protein